MKTYIIVLRPAEPRKMYDEIRIHADDARATGDFLQFLTKQSPVATFAWKEIVGYYEESARAGALASGARI